MNHCVPDFEIDDDYLIPTSASLSRKKKSPVGDEEIMELLWENGQVVMQSQNQRPVKRSHIGDAGITAEQSAARQIRSEEESANYLFMQEDEMASWLHYPMNDSSIDRDLYADLLYHGPSPAVAHPSRTTPISDLSTTDVRPIPQAAASRPPVPPAMRMDMDASARHHNLVCLSRPKRRIESGRPSSSKEAGECTVVDSSVTPAVGNEPRISQVAGSAAKVSGENGDCWTITCAAAAGTSSAAADGSGGGELPTCELTVTSSPGGSGASASAGEPAHNPPPPLAEDRKLKGIEADDAECHGEVCSDPRGCRVNQI